MNHERKAKSIKTENRDEIDAYLSYYLKVHKS